MSRKTVDVSSVLAEANRLLKLDDPTMTTDEKRGVACLLEHVLHSTDNYKGFNWNYWLAIGFQEWQDAGEPNFPEKDKYIYGPIGKELGEYDRTYYSNNNTERKNTDDRRFPMAIMG